MRKILFVFIFIIIFITISYKDSYASEPDQRFGISGNCGFAKELNIPWVYDWDTDEVYNCGQKSSLGRKVYFMVGGPDVWAINGWGCYKRDLTSQENLEMTLLAASCEVSYLSSRASETSRGHRHQAGSR